ncbi:MAG TPA: DUF559 domain-containing protein [Mycobacteriales bacterium]|jgi:very-short-patch-repair endonuclease|nr:DUF559 domain-containing protein [Mycobacteriales bacterium]
MQTPRSPYDGPFLGSAAVRDGRLTNKQLRGAQWRRLHRDVYIRADLPVDPVTRARAASLLVPLGSVLSGPTAASLHGGIPIDPDHPLEVTLPRDAPMGPRAGLHIRRALVPHSDISMIAGVAATTPLRTGFDLARRRRPRSRAELIESIVALDALAQVRRLNPDDLLAYAATHRGWRGVRLVPEVVRLTDPGAESPMETRLRLVLVLGGLPVPESQHTIRDGGGLFVARVDLAYPSLRIAIEYDGEQHRERWAQDIVRQNRIIGLGWTLMRYTSADVFRHPASIVSQVENALENRRVA